MAVITVVDAFAPDEGDLEDLARGLQHKINDIRNSYEARLINVLDMNVLPASANYTTYEGGSFRQYDHPSSGFLIITTIDTRPNT